jgi:hypothetical protein
MTFATFSDAAYHVMKSSRVSPMHIKDIVDEVFKNNLWNRRASSRSDTKYNSLYGTLIKDILNHGNNSRFGRIGNGSYFYLKNYSSEDLLYRDLKEDEMLPENETEESRIQRIKRYRKIVTLLKEKYNGHCQIAGCGFTFEKRDGSNYSEAHHLIPLSKGGTQESSNIVILCANHHRIFHFADINIGGSKDDKRSIIINDKIHSRIVYLS